MPWDIVSGMINSSGEILIDNSMQTIFLFRIQSLFFGAFSGFYLFMACQPVRYKELIFMSSLLMLLMSGAMVYVRNISGLYTSLTAYEHYIWLVIGIAMLVSWFFELRKYGNNRTKKRQNKYISYKILKILGIILFVNAFWVIMPQNLIEKTMKIFQLPSYFGNPYSEYAAGLIFFFIGILGIILFVCTMNPEQYRPILRFIAIYAILTSICLIIWMFNYNTWNIFTIFISMLCILVGISILISACINNKQIINENA
jgi:hypothetical protein